ncbi:hypothetical protein ACOSP7_018970 [Xanthoceras sorbifolium]
MSETFTFSALVEPVSIEEEPARGVEQTEVQREAQGNKPEERYGPWLQRWTTVTNGKKASEGNQNKHSSANDGGKHVGSRFDILANAEGTGEEIGRDNRSISEAVDGSLHSRGAGSVGQNSSMRAKGSNTEVLKDVTNKGGRTRSPAISKKNPASGSKGKGLTAAKATIKTKMQAQREIPRHKGKAQLGGDPERAKEYKIHDEDGEETDALKQLHRDVLAFSQGIRIKHFEDASCGQQTKCTSTDPVNNDIEQSMKIDVKSTTFDEAASLLKEAMVTATE